eukprot:TRINITY_DN133_c0_g1_i1.p1 TRINITY_DN133_c0_g1~~TRINITY_DN133_c0_g1_i1.p1  ORF type:complete len:362 (+),score=24.78 TRINITY_DN133_c0_g1_i1:140-1225(+)
MRRRLEPCVGAADRPRILFIMAANRMCPKAAWALNRDMRLRLKPAVSMRLTEASVFHCPALTSTTRILKLFSIDMMDLPLPCFPKFLKKWTVQQSEPVALPSIPDIYRIDMLDIRANSGGGWVRTLLEGLSRQRCSVGVLHLQADLYEEVFRPVAFPEGIETLLFQHFEDVKETSITVTVPDSVKHLTLEGNIVPAHVPSALQHLQLMCGLNSEPLQYIASIDGLQVLQFEECTRTTRMVYPSSLQSLTIEESSVETEPSIGDIGALPAGLKVLHISSMSINHPLGQLPAALESLDLSESPAFNQPLGKLPDGLKTLRLGPAFTQELGRLPPGLKALTVPMQYPHALAVPAGTRVTLCEST